MITAERLRELLSYDPETGIFTRLVGTTRAKAGATAGCLSNGYLAIRIGRPLYYAHRLAWLYVHGRWPAAMIDHIDGNKINNRLSNLREATNQQNLQNMGRLRSDNKSGFKGVYFDKRNQKWVAATMVNGRFKFLGYHSTPETAHGAYMNAAKELFGEFAKSATRGER